MWYWQAASTGNHSKSSIARQPLFSADGETGTCTATHLLLPNTRLQSRVWIFYANNLGATLLIQYLNSSSRACQFHYRVVAAAPCKPKRETRNAKGLFFCWIFRDWMLITCIK
jgi:hypothetical protein